MTAARIACHQRLSAILASRGDIELVELVGSGRVVNVGVGGDAAVLVVDGVPVFAKRIPLTDREVASPRRHHEPVRPAGVLSIRYRRPKFQRMARAGGEQHRHRSRSAWRDAGVPDPLPLAGTTRPVADRSRTRRPGRPTDDLDVALTAAMADTHVRLATERWAAGEGPDSAADAVDTCLTRLVTHNLL